MKFQFIVILLSFSSIFCQAPKPCTSPAQWEARISAHDYVSRASVNATMSYDANTRRQRVVENVWLNGKKLVFDVLYLDDAKVVYRFDGQENKCVKTQVTEPWKDLGVAIGAKLVSEQVIGSAAIKDANIRTNLWSSEFEDSQGNKIVSFETWSSVGCLPIDFVHFSKGANINIVKRFFDITPGIVSESVWKVRDECANL